MDNNYKYTLNEDNILFLMELIKNNKGNMEDIDLSNYVTKEEFLKAIKDILITLSNISYNNNGIVNLSTFVALKSDIIYGASDKIKLV